MKFTNGKGAAAYFFAFMGLFTTNSYAANIDITGLVVASPCIVNGGNESLSVNLGDNLLATDLSTNGSATEWKNVTLSLSNCPSSTSSFSVTFAGTADDDPDYYKNTGTATNLKLALSDSNSDTAYKNGASLKNVAIPGDSHAYDIIMRARAVSKGNVMPGTIVGQVQANFTYQ